MEEAWRRLPFSHGRNCVEDRVRNQQIDSQSELPVGDTLEVLKGDIPIRKPETLAHTASFAVKVRSG